MSPFLQRNKEAGYFTLPLWAKSLLKQSFSQDALQTQGYEIRVVNLQLQRPTLTNLKILFMLIRRRVVLG